MKSSRTEAPTGRLVLLFSDGTRLDVGACFGWFVGFGFVLFRAGNSFWSLLLQLATQVRVPGAGDVASTRTSRATSAVGRPSPEP